MPQAVLHILIPLILVALIKDYYDSHHKNKFSLHYVLIAGIAGIIPDLDVAFFWILHFFGFTYFEVHRTFAHTIFVPLFFLILFFAFKKVKVRMIRKHKIKLSVIFLMLSLGSLTHIILDGIFSGAILPLFPVSNIAIGLNLIGLLPQGLSELLIPTIEAALLVCWLIYLELKHKISDFI
jgi:hypothetical protein